MDTIISKVRAEIERRKKLLKNGDAHPEVLKRVEGTLNAYDSILSFLDTLEETDFPTTDEEMEKFLATHPRVEVPDKYKTLDFVFKKKEDKLEIPTNLDLEGEIESFIQEFGWGKTKHLAEKELINCTASHFAQWQKKQMLKDAVEGRVFMSFVPGHNQMVMADVDLPTNTKVKLIIIKED